LEKQGIPYTAGVARADNPGSVQTEITGVNPTHVVSFIGRTHGEGWSTIDYLEQKGKLYDNIRDNLFSPVLLADLCQKAGIHYTYLGTGCIFTYDEEHVVDGQGFTEKDRPNFFGSGYSTVKGFTDHMMQQRPVLNLRIRMPITGSPSPRNFITKITRYAKICSMANSMTVLPELLPLALDMMLKGLTGTINLTNPGAITHNEILAMYKELVDPLFTWENFTIDEQNRILASERSNNLLDTTKLQTLYPLVLPIKEAIRTCLASYVV
jgi:3,5-epimerase/4-reductase